MDNKPFRILAHGEGMNLFTLTLSLCFPQISSP